jgi:hypothetical protein
VLFGPNSAMRHDTNSESHDESDSGSSEEIFPFVELFPPLDNTAAAVGCQPCIQW